MSQQNSFVLRCLRMALTLLSATAYAVMVAAAGAAAVFLITVKNQEAVTAVHSDKEALAPKGHSVGSSFEASEIRFEKGDSAESAILNPKCKLV